MTVCERIFQKIEEKKLKTSDLARILDVQQSVISNWKKRNTTPPMEYALFICEFLDVSIEWLITGKENQELTSKDKELLSYFRQLPEPEQLRELGRLEARAEMFKGKLSESKIG